MHPHAPNDSSRASALLKHELVLVYSRSQSVDGFRHTLVLCAEAVAFRAVLANILIFSDKRTACSEAATVAPEARVASFVCPVGSDGLDTREF